MDTATEWRRRLDHVLTALSAQLKIELYDNVVVEVVRDWFTCWDSIDQLNKNIEQRLIDTWPLAQRKIEAAFLDFETALKAHLRLSGSISSSANLRLDEAEAQISTAVANVISAVMVVIAGTVSGGSGLALLHTGPVGWVVGAVIFGIIAFLGKDKVKGVVEDAVRGRQLPPLLKKAAKSKVAMELKLNAPKFEGKLYSTLHEACTPLYEAIGKLYE